MVRRAPGAGGARVYDVSGHVSASLGASLTVGARATAADVRARRKRALASRDTDLLHDFGMPTVATRVKVSRDARYVYAAGTYPPQVHVYDTTELSLKFKRHVSSEIVDLQVLEDDWRKFALLHADRYVDLHAQNGSHFRTRVPRPGRDLMLHRGSADLFVCGAGPDVWRLNLDQGRFLAPLRTLSGARGGNNVCGINPRNALLAFGGETGLVDVWDPRALRPGAAPAATLDVAHALRASDSPAAATARHPAVLQSNLEVTALRFDDSDGVTMAVGTSSGHALLFDLRSPHATLVRDQGYGMPIRSLKMHHDGTHVVSADPKSIKVWDRVSGRNLVAVEPDADINHVCLFGSSGVMCAAAEDSRVRSYYIPALGPAPQWCSFLDSFTEELEDAATTATSTARRDSGFGDDTVAGDADSDEVYENYKFVPRDQLDGLGLTNLIGTDMLKPYMHGFFVHMRLYRRAVDAASPFAYQEYKKERAREKIEAERESRISKTKNKSVVAAAKVNKDIAEQLLRKQKHARGKKGSTSAEIGASVLDDERFSAMFKNADFKVREDDERFQHLNPSGVADGESGKRGRNATESESDNSDAEYLEQFDVVDDDLDSARKLAANSIGSDSDGLGMSSSDEANSDGSDADVLESKEAGGSVPGGRKQKRLDGDRISKSTSTRRPRMYELTKSGEVLRPRATIHKSDDLPPSVRRKLRDSVPLHKRIGLKIDPPGLQRKVKNEKGGRPQQKTRDRRR